MKLKKDIIILLVGKSASGKSTIAKYLEDEYGIKQVLSYTTRPMREGEEDNPTHIHVTDEEFDELKNFVGYTEYDGHRYAATEEQVSECGVYVIDPDGVEFFKKNYNGTKDVVVVYVEANRQIRMRRMLDRGDDVRSMTKRLDEDDKRFHLYGGDVTVINEDKMGYVYIGDMLAEKYFVIEDVIVDAMW